MVFAEELAERSVMARPVQELAELLRSRHFNAMQNGHTWFSLDLEEDGLMHADEATKLQEAFEEVVRSEGFVFDLDSKSPFAYTFRLEPPKGPIWPGPVKVLLAAMKAKCQQQASNGHTWCCFDLAEDGLLHKVEAAKLKDSFARAARSEGLGVRARSALCSDQPCFEIRWGAKAKRSTQEDTLLEPPRKLRRADAGGA
eukprot:TRINITY_DN38569_c0_g1_i1.p1 TRINITY_DN38569_c0_g1~~TRINITY_DN38569_c0_g1_i1.p1  ORF type:complete len:199 (+),score=63.27 TRINITY_DN38569_c0_g1_i1:55-651(+)